MLKLSQELQGGPRYTTSGSIPSKFRKLSFSISIFSAQQTFALVSRHLSFTMQISLAMTREQVLENLIAQPPAPQNPSKMVSHLILLAMCQATASGVTLDHDSSSKEIPQSNLSKRKYLRFQFLSKYEPEKESDRSCDLDLLVNFFALAEASTLTVFILAKTLPFEVPITTI